MKTQKIGVDWPNVARLFLTSRTIDIIQEEELAPKGKITYQFSSKGHELAQILLGLALNHPRDAAGVYYRSRPFMLASGLTVREAFAADMALTGSPSEGRDVGVVYSMPPRTGATVLPSSGDVGAQYTPIAGWAQAIQFRSGHQKKKDWDRAIAVALGGDGSVATNGFWSSLIMATTLNLPMIFFIEDNGFGISVPRSFQTPGSHIGVNLRNFENLHVISGSGTNPPEAADLINQAVGHARAGNGPVLLRLRVPRLQGHTFGEDQAAYKSGEMLKKEQAEDPFEKLQKYVKNDVNWDELQTEVIKDVRAALADAMRSPAPGQDEVDQHLFFSVPPAVPPVSSPEQPAPTRFEPPQAEGARINMVEAIRKVMETELEANPDLLVFGEDVGPRGGVHRVTLGLQAKFGEARVFDTSLSEEGIMGRAAGLAMAGLRPLPEIQFRKYADPAYEQMHDTGWIRWRTAGKFAAPVVVRIPVGHSKKTGDPWHSVSDEVVYAHMQGWRIAMPSNAADAAGLLRMALREQEPTIFMEHRALLDTPPARTPYPGDEYCLPFGVAATLQEGKYLTVISWGEMVHRCLEAADSFKGDVEILDLRTIVPWDRQAVLASVRKTGRALIAHEDTRTAGFGAEIAAVITEEAFTSLDAPVQRIATRDIPIPYNIGLMNVTIPTVDEIRAKMEGLLGW